MSENFNIPLLRGYTERLQGILQDQHLRSANIPDIYEQN